MGNELKYPYKKAGQKIPDSNAVRVMGALGWVLRMVRVPVFLVMYWLRPLVLLVCNLVAVPLLFAWLFAWYAFPDKTAMVWSFATLSFVAVVIGWTYDFILVVLSPQDMMRVL